MKTLYTLIFIFCCSPFFAQIQGKGGVPTTNKLVLDQKAIEQWLFEQPNIATLSIVVSATAKKTS